MRLIAVLALMTAPPSAASQTAPPPAASQNPSPMIEETRAHERLAARELAGAARSFAGPGGKPVEILVPDKARTGSRVDLVIHFHGASWLPKQAVAALENGSVAAVVNLGAGSGLYHRTFADPPAFDSLLTGTIREISAATGKPAQLDRITLVGFSAGHGAIRAIIRDPGHFARVDAILLLDGMHTSYVPEGSLLAAGGALDTTNLAAFAGFARAAIKGEKRFVVTHSEIFPGTFASTTETADWLIKATGLERTPVLKWGHRGMQQLSEVRSGRFELLGFAGNSGPDHIDHLHAMPELLERTLRASIASADVCCPVASASGKKVHHYVFFGQDRDKLVKAQSFLGSRRLEGAQVSYTWRQLEPRKDEYDFSRIREDLALLTPKGKKLFIQLQDVSFYEDRINVPRLPSERSGLQRGQGINFAETSIEVGSTGRLFPKGFSFSRYRDAVIENMAALKEAFPKSVTLQYGNFMPGEWRPTNDKGYLRSVYTAAANMKVGVGGPDLLPFRPGQLKEPYPLIREHSSVVPVGIAVQDGNYGDRNPKTGQAASIPELLKFATEFLDVDYLFWSTEEPYYSRDVIPFFMTRD